MWFREAFVVSWENLKCFVLKWDDAEYLSIISPDVQKYEPEKHRIRILFMQCVIVQLNPFLANVFIPTENTKKPQLFWCFQGL